MDYPLSEKNVLQRCMIQYFLLLLLLVVVVLVLVVDSPYFQENVPKYVRIRLHVKVFPYNDLTFYMSHHLKYM